MIFCESYCQEAYFLALKIFDGTFILQGKVQQRNLLTLIDGLRIANVDLSM